MSNLTGFLYAAPSFFRGMASVLDMGSTLTMYNISETPESADAKAIRSDWSAIGVDLLHAMEGYSGNVKVFKKPK